MLSFGGEPSKKSNGRMLEFKFLILAVKRYTGQYMATANLSNGTLEYELRGKLASVFRAVLLAIQRRNSFGVRY